MLLAILLQSVAMGRVGSTVNPLADFEHATLHWQAGAAAFESAPAPREAPIGPCP